jgi:hypothetical protein
MTSHPVVLRAASLPGASKAYVVDEAVEDRERFGAVEPGCSADVAVRDRSRPGELEDDVGELGRREPQARRRLERPAQSVRAADALTLLLEEALVP